jgi:leucyl-tRNA synthetase
MWETTGHDSTLDNVNWPTFDTEAVKEDVITIIVQVNGKVRARLEVPATIDDDELKKQATRDPRVIKFTEGKEPKKIIVVPKKLVNIVL